MRIIAEIGTLHSKDLRTMIDVVAQCFDAGADLVKTQLINPGSAWWANEKQLKRYKELHHSLDEWHWFFETCKARFDKPVFASIFDPCYLELDLPIIKFGYKMHEVMNDYISFLDHTDKEILISADGDAYCSDVIGRYYSKENIKFLYCMPVYPICDGDVLIPILQHSSNTSHWSGVSVHTNNMRVLYQILINYIAYPRNDNHYLELHVQGDHAYGYDKLFSLHIGELKELCIQRDFLYTSGV